MHLLDTSALIEIFDNTKTGIEIANYMQDKEFFVSSLTLYELWKKKNPSSQLIYFIQHLQAFPFDNKSAAEGSNIFRVLREAGKPINEIDILIAATAISKDLELITADTDFTLIKKFSNLKLRFFNKNQNLI